MPAYQALRGMHDALPEHSARLRALEQVLIGVARQYDFQEIRTPILESTALFSRGVGDDTDIVNKEMYEFADKSGESVCLRPENTAAIVRAAIEHNLLRGKSSKLWYLGPMFRYERPQKGRYRQLHQFGCEILGDSSVAAEVELIALSALAFERLGLTNVRLELNNLGSAETRANYKALLQAYLQEHYAELDPDSQRRLTTNPLRILDSKNEQTQAIVAQAPRLVDSLSSEERQAAEELVQLLRALGIEPVINPMLVRGLDYYTGMVFEWITDSLGAQGTVCGGGRYDNLIAELGGPSTPALGFALGMERLELLSDYAVNSAPDVYVISLLAARQVLPVIHTIRQRAPNLSLSYAPSSSKFPKQLQKADKSRARMALIFNDDGESLSLKELQSDGSQQSFSYQQIDQLISALISP